MKLLVVCHAGSYLEGDLPKVQIAPWVEAFCKTMGNSTNYQLSVLFQCEYAKRHSFSIGHIHYYPLSTGLSNNVKKWWYKFTDRITIPHLEQRCRVVLGDVNPDLIVVFGTEFDFIKIKNYTKVPVVVHLQSVVNSYLPHWYTAPITQQFVKKNANKFLYAKGAGVLHAYSRFLKQAKRESTVGNQIEFYFGRTGWDKREILKIAPNAQYFHVDEVMREEFYHIELTQTQAAFSVLTVINPNVYKGLDLILETCTVLSEIAPAGLDFTWKIAGIDSQSEVLRIARSAVNYRESRIKPQFLGAQSAQSLMRLLAATTCYVQPSYIENSSNSMCEAMLAGLPVVALNKGGNSDLIEHFVSGILIEQRDAHALAQQLLFLAQNPSETDRIGSKARSIAIQRHHPENVRLQVQNAISVICKGHANNK